MPKLNIFSGLKDLLKNIPLIHVGKAKPLIPVRPANPPIEPPKPVKPIQYDK
jgi:hypothetical protein